MRLVVVESPYAGEVERNVTYARRALADCLKRGEAPIASHLLYTQPGVLDDLVPEERKLGIEAGLAWGAHGEIRVIYNDYGISRGMEYGIANAKKAGCPVVYRYIGKNPEVSLPEETFKLVGDLVDGVLWCGGSSDFSPEGAARQGWVDVIAPLLQRARGWMSGAGWS